MKSYKLTFDHVNAKGERVSSYDERGQEVSLMVEAESKTMAAMSDKTREFALVQGNDTRVRRVT